MVSQMAQSEAGIWVYLHGQAQKASLRSSGRPSFKYSGHVGGTLESLRIQSGMLVLHTTHWRSQGAGARPPPEIGFTRKFLAALLS